jgi:hypothetical protein
MTLLMLPGPLQITQQKAPCVLHRFHSPVTVINELHHAFPEYMQAHLWGKTLDQTKISICATGHNTLHATINALMAGQPIPRGVGFTTRRYAKYAVDRYATELKKLGRTA